MSSKTEKYISYAMLVLLVLALIPVIYLGRYNHPTGDDYYYTVTTKLAWEESGSIFEVLKEAFVGIVREYHEWQGTYSAMFFMYLAPNLFGDWAYRLVPAMIILALVGSIFYVLKTPICKWLGGSKASWITVSAVISLLCVETVPTQSETFFWYNGAMYYTGFLAVTLFFIGLLLRWMQQGGKVRYALSLMLAFFLAGGNYVSLLPCILTVLTLTVYMVYKKDRRAWMIGAVAVVMLFGLLISAVAPGNQIRQSDMWKIPAWKAIVKSLVQGARYALAWIDGWWGMTAVLITPTLWKCLKTVEFRFSYPFVVIGYVYGLFCSMSCPTFYTMNSTGPARAVAIVYYGFVLASFFAYAYLLGWIQKRFAGKMDMQTDAAKTRKTRWQVVAAVAIILLFGVQCLTGKLENITTLKSMELLANGEAKAYEQEYRERMEILEDDGIAEVVFRPYEHQPDMLYVGDISGDASEDLNVRMAKYFHKKSIRVEY